MQEGKTNRISLILISSFAGFLLIGHINTSSFARPDDPLGQKKDQEQIANMLIEEQSKLKNKISTLREEIEILSQSAKKNLKEEHEYLEKLRKALALSEEKGPGLIVTIEDSPLAERPNLEPYDDLLVHAADLRDIVQRLWSGGASSISINGQRITSLSPITCVGNAILINDIRMLPPFKIIALGDPEILSQEMNLELYLPDLFLRTEKGSLKISIQSSENLTVPVYDGSFKTDYLKLSENE